jgi:hypothetical protein
MLILIYNNIIYNLMERDKNSIGSVVKSFDIFRKLPSDVTSGTQSGAISI